MSATVDQEVAAAEVDTPFKFVLTADENGSIELGFKKDAAKIFQVLIFAMGKINSTFEIPFATTGEFIRELANASDSIDEVVNATNEEAIGQQEAE